MGSALRGSSSTSTSDSVSKLGKEMCAGYVIDVTNDDKCPNYLKSEIKKRCNPLNINSQSDKYRCWGVYDAYSALRSERHRKMMHTHEERIERIKRINERFKKLKNKIEKKNSEPE